jgi:diguanylate cyclase (GGDEF)-like protein
VIRLSQADRQTLLVVVRVLDGLLPAAGPEEVTAALEDGVRALGGTVVPPQDESPDALPFDLSCGTGPTALPAAPAGSQARARLELVLPALLDNARIAVARASHDLRLAEMVQVDALTGLLNRRATERVVARLDTSATVAVLDLDHFKLVNDRYGHAAGDEVLTVFGRHLLEHGRAEDRYGRLGGEEFVGVFAGMPVGEVVAALDRLRADWRQVAPYATTFSAGVAAVGPAGGEQALKAADAALYSAKRAGRDTTRVAPSQAPQAARPDAGGEPPRLPRSRAAEARRGLLDRSTTSAFAAHVAAGDVRAATELVLTLLDRGLGLRAVIVELLVPAQREAGRRWQAGAWSVAQEHLTTSVVDGVLAAATFGAGSAPARGESRPRVLLVCPEGEWHQLPSRMFAALLVQTGVDVVQLGPSLPADELARALGESRYDAVALSCTLLSSLTAAAAAIRAAHAAGVPVLAGGRAFGRDAVRATTLGADGWTDDVDEAAALLRRWAHSRPAPRRPAVAVAHPLADLAPGVLEDLVAAAQRRQPGTDLEAAGTTAEDLRQVLCHLDAATVTDDPRLFAEFCRWHRSVLTARGLGSQAVEAQYRVLEEALGPEHGRAAALLRRAGRAVSPTASPQRR